MSRNDVGRWAVAGGTPEARFLLERHALRREFPIVAVHPAATSDCDPVDGMFILPDWNQLLSDARITGVILTVPPERRSPLILDALMAGKNVLVEGSLGTSVDELTSWRRRLATGPQFAGVFHLRTLDTDDQTALSAVNTGRLGRLSSIRWVSCVYSQAADPSATESRPSWTEHWQHSGPWLLHRLGLLMREIPRSVAAWLDPETAGIQLRLEYSSGPCAWLEMRRASLCGWETGWILEGTQGAYRNGRVFSLAADGEVLEETLTLPSETDNDVMRDLRRLAVDPDAALASFDQALEIAGILSAIQQAARSRPIESVVDSDSHSLPAATPPTGTRH